jgi:hypothetical protein
MADILHADSIEGELKTVAEILDERHHQISLGYDAVHDDQHPGRALSYAALAYVTDAAMGTGGDLRWPWAVESFKPEDERGSLVKAGALILARIEQIDRRGVAA